MGTPGRVARVGWAVVGLLWAVALLNYLDRQLVVTMSRPIKADLTIGDAKFGLFPSVFLWVYGACSPVAGYVADRVGKRPVILLSLLVWSAATFYTGLVESFGGMLAARAALGVSEAFYMPAAVALIVDYHRGPTRARATGLHLSGVYAGSVLGGLGGWAADEFGWRFGFLLFGGVGVGYALLLIVLLPHPPADDPDPHHEPNSIPPGAFAALLGSAGFVLLLVMNLLNGAAYWPVRNWLPTFFQDEFGIGQARAGIYGPMAFNAAAFAGMLLGSSISDWWARTNPRARAMVPAVGFCVAAPCLFAIGAVEIVAVILACVVVAGMSQGFLDANLMPAACTLCDPRHRATAYGLLNLVGITAGGVMTFVGGVLKERQVPFGVTFQAASGFILLAGLLLFAVRPRRIS